MEAEVFLLGKWKNFDELEDELSLPEIDFILGAKRKEEHTWWKYYAGFKGVDLDKNNGDSVENRLKEVERRAAERLYGAEAVERQEFADLGFDFNVG